MKRTIFFRRLLVPAVLMSGLLTGCIGSVRPVDFYTLSALSRSTEIGDGTQKIIIALFPVSIPQYIDRPQIVTRTDDNRIALSESHLWGGSLKNEITRVLAENLNELTADHGATVLIDAMAVNPGYVIMVNVSRFDGRFEDRVWLNAAWSIRDPVRKMTLAVNISDIQEKIEAQGFAALVAAESRAIAALSNEIAQTLSIVLKAAR